MITPHDILNFKNTRIFIAGDLILDSYIEGKVSRISPEAPVPIMLETNRRSVPGGAGNVAANIASMGGQAFLCGRVGHDDAAKTLGSILKEFEVDTSYFVISQKLPTTLKTRLMSRNSATSSAQQIVRIDKEVCADLLPEEESLVLKNYENFLNEGGQRCLILSDYGKGFLTKLLIQKLISLSKKFKIPVITDPKSSDVNRYEGSTVIKPNLTEGRAVLRTLKPGAVINSFEQEIKVLSDCYLNASGCDNLVMSLSEHGVICEGKDIEGTLHFETRALQVADVSGAGDTLIAFLAMGMAAGLGLARATEIGNIAAGIVCGKLGTATLSPSEFLETFKEQTEAIHPEKLMSLEDLKFIAENLKEQEKRIVFTNGCFDLLHAGHTDYLQKARALGTHLIVGINSDQSVKKLKGETRPLQNVEDRAAILAALACVDYIVIFDEETPIRLISALKPDVLVKGADYNIESTVGAKEVLSWGGKIAHIDLLPGRSTSSIIQRIEGRVKQ